MKNDNYGWLQQMQVTNHHLNVYVGAFVTTCDKTDKVKTVKRSK